MNTNKPEMLFPVPKVEKTSDVQSDETTIQQYIQQNREMPNNLVNIGVHRIDEGVYRVNINVRDECGIHVKDSYVATKVGDSDSFTFKPDLHEVQKRKMKSE